MRRTAVVFVALAATFGIPGAANGSKAAATPGTAATRTVRYDGYTFRVPAGWPVYRLGADSTTCVRYDTSAVYLGIPGKDQRCPARLIGQADTVSIAPSGAAAPTVVRQSAGAGGQTAQRPGLSVTATYGSDPGVVQQVLSSVRDTRTGAPAVVHQTAPAPAAPAAPAAKAPAATRLTAPAPRALPGFDTCTAPSLQAMKAWRRSYSAAAIYIGGQEMACGYGNLSASWVTSVRRMGWKLIPIYVGLQAPCDGFSQKIQPSHAAPEGMAAANSAFTDAQSLGIWRGAPIYFDMEAYNSANTTCRNSVLSFLDQWTRQLHARGYVSGVYSSAASGAEDLGNATSVYGRPLAKPDSIWFALWDNKANLVGTPYLLPSWWTPDRRIKQYQGGHLVKVGGIRLDIDSDWVQGAVY